MKSEAKHTMNYRYLILTGPSGVGKTTLAKMLAKRAPEHFVEAIGTTTREPRPGEVDGVHYNFKTLDEFNDSDYIEVNAYEGNKYGYHKDNLWAGIHEPDRPKTVVFVVHVEAVLHYPLPVQLTKRVVLMYPSLAEIARRTADRVERRSKIAKEIAYVNQTLVHSQEVTFIENVSTLETYRHIKSLLGC